MAVDVAGADAAPHPHVHSLGVQGVMGEGLGEAGASPELVEPGGQADAVFLLVAVSPRQRVSGLVGDPFYRC